MNLLNFEALIFSIPIIIIFVYSVQELFDELRFTQFHRSLDIIIKKSKTIRELCYCKTIPCGGNKCPILKDIENINKHKYVSEKYDTPYLKMEDLNNPIDLAAKLKNPKDTVSIYINDNVKEIRDVLDDYNFIKSNGKNYKLPLNIKKTNRLQSIYLDLRRSIIIFFLGEWHPGSNETSSRTISEMHKYHAHPGDLVKQLSYKLCVILNEKFIYGKCIYEIGKFPDLDKKLTPLDKALLETAIKSGTAPSKSVQLNRIILDSNYKDEIKKNDYINYLWKIVKRDVILGNKQAYYFELAAVQFFALGLVSLKPILSVSMSGQFLDLSHAVFPQPNLIISVCLSAIFIFAGGQLITSKDVEPFGWFKNRWLRVLATTVFLAFGYWLFLYITDILTK